MRESWRMADFAVPRGSSQASAGRIEVLYVVYWGALEPLGKSLVIPWILGLAESGVKPTLITFEKLTDFSKSPEVEELRSRFHTAGILWKPLRYHKTPKWPATALDAVTAVLTAAWLAVSRRYVLVHARTFVAGIFGFLIARLLRARFVYHNEGFYPDEQVDAGVWRAGAVPHRVATLLETALYRHADGVIALSARSLPDIVERRGRPNGLTVSPSAIDLMLFESGALPPPWSRTERLRLCYLGSIGGRYRTDDLMRFVAAFARLLPVHLLVLSGSDPKLLRCAAEKAAVPPDLYETLFVSHDEVPGRLASCHVGLHFLPRTKGTTGGSPTKIGEYWACGLPVVVSSGIGDIDQLIEGERVGVIVKSATADAVEDAAEELVALLSDEGLATRCRRAAANHYGLPPALRSQTSLYRTLLDKHA